MSLYFWLILGTIAGPFFLSFDKKVHFYTRWKAVFPALVVVGIIFLIWDEYFATKGIWGFNSDYLAGIYIGHLPLEECLFFLVVPYSCVFIHEVVKVYFPNLKTALIGRIFAFTIGFSGFYFGLANSNNWYTASACLGAALLVTGAHFVFKLKWFGTFAVTFLIVLIPFLLVNGALTGTFTAEPIVWYNEAHIIGWRIITIPFEDLYYNLCLLLPVIWIYERLRINH